jgi:hypothetical protein
VVVTEPPAAEARLLSVRKAMVNLVGFAVGLGLFIWIVVRAVGNGQWDRLGEASLWSVAALLGCTLLSAVTNGAAFWVTVQPIRRLGFMELQLINIAANMLNYAPLRLGALGRVVYHHRVDRLSLVQIAGWFAVLGYVLVLGVGSCIVATLLRQRVDGIWLLLVVGQMALGGAMARVVASHPLARRFGRGVDRMIADPRSIWGALALRLVDLAAYAGRMAAAVAILDMEMAASQIVILSLVALAASLIPFGRLGFREACVALTAARLNLGTEHIEAAWAQLALVESMGEAVIFVPLGGLTLLWLRHRWGAWLPAPGTAPVARHP